MSCCEDSSYKPETKGKRFGWIPDLPDTRDFTATNQKVKKGEKESVSGLLSKTGILKATVIPTSSDLRQWCSPIEDQQSLGSCTANAAMGLVEYFEKKAHGKYIDGSRLFVYKTTRRLAHLTGDSGAYLRNTMGALVLFGVPPEEFWPYDPVSFDREPSAFCYAFAENYKAIKYYRLDPKSLSPQAVLDRIKIQLGVKLPCMFGFSVFNSYVDADQTGEFPCPGPSENIVGGHAICIVGHDDKKVIQGTSSQSPVTTGAFLIRNSWGTGWGNLGYGWLPYDYLLQGLAEDFWSLVKADWIETGQFAE